MTRTRVNQYAVQEKGTANNLDNTARVFVARETYLFAYSHPAASPPRHPHHYQIPPPPLDPPVKNNKNNKIQTRMPWLRYHFNQFNQKNIEKNSKIVTITITEQFKKSYLHIL